MSATAPHTRQRGQTDSNPTRRLRPVHHRAVHRIHAHIALTVVALLLERMAEHDCADTWRNIRDDLKRIQLAQLIGPNGTLRQVTDPRPSAADRLNSLRITPPATNLKPVWTPSCMGIPGDTRKGLICLPKSGLRIDEVSNSVQQRSPRRLGRLRPGRRTRHAGTGGGSGPILWWRARRRFAAPRPAGWNPNGAGSTGSRCATRVRSALSAVSVSSRVRTAPTSAMQRASCSGSRPMGMLRTWRTSRTRRSTQRIAPGSSTGSRGRSRWCAGYWRRTPCRGAGGKRPPLSSGRLPPLSASSRYLQK